MMGSFTKRMLQRAWLKLEGRSNPQIIEKRVSTLHNTYEETHSTEAVPQTPSQTSNESPAGKVVELRRSSSAGDFCRTPPDCLHPILKRQRSVTFRLETNRRSPSPISLVDDEDQEELNFTLEQIPDCGENSILPREASNSSPISIREVNITDANNNKMAMILLDTEKVAVSYDNTNHGRGQCTNTDKQINDETNTAACIHAPQLNRTKDGQLIMKPEWTTAIVEFDRETVARLAHDLEKISARVDELEAALSMQVLPPIFPSGWIILGLLLIWPLVSSLVDLLK